MSGPTLPPGVTFLQRGWRSANGVLLHGEQTVLIDSGHVLDVADTTVLVGRALGDGTRVEAVWLTHAHSDHAGGAHAFQQAGAEIWAHPETAARVNAWDERALWISYADQVHARFRVTRIVAADHPVTINDLTLVPIHVPGHATGMVALYCPEHRFLITADALWEDGFGPLVEGAEGPAVLAQQRASVGRLAALDVELVLPGHGAAFTDFAGVCGRALARLDAYEGDPRRMHTSMMRAYFIHHLLEVEGMSEPDVPGYCERVPCYRDTRAAAFPDADPAEFWVAFVDALVSRGLVRRVAGRLTAHEAPARVPGRASPTRAHSP